MFLIGLIEKIKSLEIYKKLLLASLVLILLIGSIFYIQDANSLSKKYYKLNSLNISKAEYDFFYNTNYLSFIKNNKSNLNKIGLNLKRDLSEQKSIDKTNSWKSYFQKTAVEFNKEIVAISSMAAQNGFSKNREELFDEYIKNIENEVKNSDDTFEKVIRNRHGKNATVKSIEKPLKKYLYANAYIEYLRKNKKFTNNEYEAFYKKNKDNLDKVDYRSFATVDEKVANTIYDNSKDENSYKEQIIKNAPAEELELFKKDSSTKLVGVKKIDLDKNVASWLYNPDRKEGDMAVVKSQDGSHYEVLYFLQRYRDNTSGVNLKIIFLDKDDENLASSIYEKIKDGDEEHFNNQVKEHTTIKNDKDTNGFYKNFPKGYLTEDFDSWAYNRGRKNGDVIKIKYESGFIIARFQSKNEKESWKINAESDMLNQYISEKVKDQVKKIKLNDVNHVFSFK